MNTYQTVLVVHLTSVVLSICLFTLRGFWMLTANDLLNHKITRTLPHVIDTILLGAAIFLTILIQHYPGQSHWLSVKVIALLFYIGFGTIALKRGKTMKQRILALILAWLTFAFIVSVAVYHHPAGIFVLAS
ncbi:MAG: SirB2 family protein [Pseudomonadales bacterium]|nr:SirB2 family protein [Pseudomonadales bacterium]